MDEVCAGNDSLATVRLMSSLFFLVFYLVCLSFWSRRPFVYRLFVKFVRPVLNVFFLFFLFFIGKNHFRVSPGLPVIYIYMA